MGRDGPHGLRVVTRHDSGVPVSSRHPATRIEAATAVGLSGLSSEATHFEARQTRKASPGGSRVLRTGDVLPTWVVLVGRPIDRLQGG